MEEEKIQRLHDTLSKLRRGKGLGVSSHYNFGGDDGVPTEKDDSGNVVRKDGLPMNGLYANFVREGEMVVRNKYGDGRTIKRNFDDCSSPSSASTNSKNDSDDSSSSSDSSEERRKKAKREKKKAKAALKSAKKAERKAQKLEAKRQAKRQAKKQAALEAKKAAKLQKKRMAKRASTSDNAGEVHAGEKRKHEDKPDETKETNADPSKSTISADPSSPPPAKRRKRNADKKKKKRKKEKK